MYRHHHIVRVVYNCYYNVVWCLYIVVVGVLYYPLYHISIHSLRDGVSLRPLRAGWWPGAIIGLSIPIGGKGPFGANWSSGLVVVLHPYAALATGSLLS